MVNLSNAAVAKGQKFKKSFYKAIGTGFFLAFYYFNKDHAEIETKRLAVNPKFEVAHKVWNLLDTSVIKQFYVKSLPSIKYRNKLFVKKYEREINLEYIAVLIEKIKNYRHKNTGKNSEIISTNYMDIINSSGVSNNNTNINARNYDESDVPFVKKIKKEEKNSTIIFN
jgi:hypothetical protein